MTVQFLTSTSMSEGPSEDEASWDFMNPPSELTMFDCARMYFWASGLSTDHFVRPNNRPQLLSYARQQLYELMPGPQAICV